MASGLELALGRMWDHWDVPAVTTSSKRVIELPTLRIQACTKTGHRCFERDK
jgi:hypothetical protein